MGVARVNFVEDCDVLVGGQPDDPNQPILAPHKIGKTNTPFMIPEGLHCFSVAALPPFSPLWQVGQVTAGGPELVLTFTRP